MSRPLFSWRQAVLMSGLPPTTRHVLLTLSCHMTDTGEGCFPAVSQLVAETGLSHRAVLTHLKNARLHGFIESARHGFSGQKWARNEYRIKWPDEAEGGERGSISEQKGGERRSNSDEKGGERGAPPCEPLIFRSTSISPPLSPPTSASDGCAVPSDIANTAEGEVRKLAEWMLAKLRQLNPQHREPNWRRWEREIRLMATRDQHTLREIAQLFAWANADPFWSSNILSPGKLRQKWDELVIKRAKAGGRGAPPPPAEDRGCVRCGNGTPGRRQVPGVGWLCNHHLDEMEAAVHE